MQKGWKIKNGMNTMEVKNFDAAVRMATIIATPGNTLDVDDEAKIITILKSREEA